jgi:hypothetical protein
MKNIIGYTNIALSLFFVMGRVTRVHAQTSSSIICETNGINTAIGCIHTDPGSLINSLFSVSLGIAGGIAFLMILLGSLQIQTSTGNPERVNQGREIIEGAIIGLLLIIFSVFILRVVGVDVLAIPGFRP